MCQLPRVFSDTRRLSRVPQEVVADDTPAVQVVLNADEKRCSLLKEKTELEKKQTKGDMSVMDRLNQVRTGANCMDGRTLWR